MTLLRLAPYDDLMNPYERFVCQSILLIHFAKILKVPQAIAYHEEITNVSNEAQRWRLCLSKQTETIPNGGSALEIAEEPT